MTPQEYIESGILEFYVYGILTETENEEVIKMASQHPEIMEEILHIENSVIMLSGSVAPKLSGKNYEKIKSLIFNDHTEEKEEVIPEKSKSGLATYLGWIAAVILLVAGGYFFLQNETGKKNILNLQTEQSKLQQEIIDSELKSRQSDAYLSIIRNRENRVISLEGQDAAPKAFAKIYWNSETHQVYVDGLNLPEPPEGMVYQVWALELNPLTPLSIGLLEDFRNHSSKIFELDNVIEAEAFGITLEPSGGSPTPTLEQLFVLGKV